MTRLPTVVLAAAALAGFIGAAAIPAGYLVYWHGAPMMLAPLLGILALAGFGVTPVLLPVRPQSPRTKNAAGLSAHLPAALAGGTGAAVCSRGAHRGAHKLPANHSRRPGPPALGAGGPTPTPGREPVDRLTPHYRPGRATVHQGGSA